MAGPETDHTIPQDVPALYGPLLARLGGGLPVDQQMSLLVDEAVPVWSRPGFETFLSLSSLRFTPFDYQLQAARVALRRMRGRAILADEVGLGKTIEADLILAELRLRGLADRCLIITPPGLLAQWQEELERKFAVPTALAGRETAIPGREAGTSGPGGGIDRPVIIASLATARRDPLRSVLTGDQWDLIIVDEAHRVRAPRSASGKLIRALRSRHLLLLTATPVENRLQDLYEMVSLVAHHGSLPRAEKERAVAAFRDEVGVLLSTESAGEGRNLQLCHVMVNMDLPWNPMQIEQRLGRLHRVGQDHDVLLTNLVARQGFVKVAGGVQPGESPVRSRNCRAWRGSWAQRRVSLAKLVTPCMRNRVMTRLARADQICGPFPVRMRDLSSFQITSRSQWACSTRQWPRTWASRSSGVVSSAARLVMQRTASARVCHWPDTETGSPVGARQRTLAGAAARACDGTGLSVWKGAACLMRRVLAGIGAWGLSAGR